MLYADAKDRSWLLPSHFYSFLEVKDSIARVYTASDSRSCSSVKDPRHTRHNIPYRTYHLTNSLPLRSTYLHAVAWL